MVRRLVSVAVALAWPTVIGLLVLTLTRLLRLETSLLVVILQTGTTYVYLPAYVALALALFARRRWLVIASAVVVIAHALFLLSGMPPAQPVPTVATAAPKLKLYTHNVLYRNPRPQEIARSIAEVDADVVLLQELSPSVLDAVRAGGVLNRYPHEYLAPQEKSSGLGILSKLPLSGTSMVASPGFPLMQADVSVGGTSVRLYNVHTQAPVANSPRFWLGDLQLLDELLAEEPGRVIAAGDFNATWYHRPFRELLDNGYGEVHRDRGRGWVRTWPVGSPSGDAINGWIRLDHILTSPGLQAVSASERDGHGSDHRGLVATIAVVPTAPD